MLGLLLAPSALAGIFTPESGGSPNAEDIASLYEITLYIAIVIFVLVEGTLIWSLIRYRAGGRTAASPHRSAATLRWRSAGRSAPR